jgi:hypothetical protein
MPGPVGDLGTKIRRVEEVLEDVKDLLEAFLAYELLM